MATIGGDPSRIPTPAGSAFPAAPRSRGAHVRSALTEVHVDRVAAERADEVPVGEDVRYLVTSGARIAVTEDAAGMRLALERSDPRTEADAPLVYLGRGGGLRLVAAEVPDPAAGDDEPARDLRELRRVAAELDPQEASFALTAVGMAGWIRTHRHCPRCGAPVRAESAGWVLRCTEDGSQHFPRTDPAVIMAVRDADDRLLLARNASFRGRFSSVLAGFVEPGETLEAAVAREVREEVGLVVDEVEYAGSQPWPFPRSLMLGFRAWASSATDLVLQADEIAEARWYTRDELAAALADGSLALPGSASIARALIEDWYGDTLSG